MDWKTSRLGPMPPESMVSVAQAAFGRVLAACGTPPSLFLDADGTAQREAVRCWHLGTVLPLARLLEHELTRKLETEVKLRFDSYALDLARISHQGHGLRRVQAFDPQGAGRKAYRGIRSRPATPRADAWARPEGRRCPADSVRHAACPMHRIALRAVPALSAGQRRADHDRGEKCGLAGRAQAFQKLVGGGVPVDEALETSGLLVE